MTGAFAILMVLLCMTSVTGCGKQSIPDKARIVGGWRAADRELTQELTAVFYSATDKLTDISYKPLKLLATQVVAGVNYRFLVEETVLLADHAVSQKILTVYVDLQGNASVTSIEDYVS